MFSYPENDNEFSTPKIDLKMNERASPMIAFTLYERTSMKTPIRYWHGTYNFNIRTIKSDGPKLATHSCLCESQIRNR